MKYLIFLALFLLLFNCSNNKSVYWCGDHACINKKEKEAFFKKTMIVEKRELNEKYKLSKTEKDEILKQIRSEEVKEEEETKKYKESVKHARLENKRRTNDMYSLENRIQLRKNYKEQKRLKKQARKEEKARIKQNKYIPKDKAFNAESASLKKDESFSKFDELKQKITRKNMMRPYPNINEIQN